MLQLHNSLLVTNKSFEKTSCTNKENPGKQCNCNDDYGTNFFQKMETKGYIAQLESNPES